MDNKDKIIIYLANLVQELKNTSEELSEIIDNLSIGRNSSDYIKTECSHCNMNIDITDEVFDEAINIVSRNIGDLPNLPIIESYIKSIANIKDINDNEIDFYEIYKDLMNERTKELTS